MEVDGFSSPKISHQQNTVKPLSTIPSDETEDNSLNEILQMMDLSAMDSKYSWFVVFCSFFCNMIVDGVQYTFSNVLGPIIISFHSTTTAVSLISSLLSGFYNFSGPLAGALANKFGFRMVAVTGAIMSAFGMCMSYFATDLGILYFTYGILGGLGFGMIYMAAVITTSLYFNKYRALATSISVCGTGVGTFIFSPFGNWLVTSYGWRIALAVEGGIVLLCIIFGLAFKPNEIINYGPLSEEDNLTSTSMTTIRTIRTIRESILATLESGRPLHNEAYLTLKQALMMQDDDGKRSLYSYYTKSGRASIVMSNAQSLSIRQWMPSSDENEEQVVNLTGYENFKHNCKTKIRKYCCNVWHCRCHEKKNLTVGDRPMYRDDVFYEGSLSYLPNYSKISEILYPLEAIDFLLEKNGILPGRKDPINYHLSVIRMPNERDAAEHMNQKCCRCHEAMLRTCVTMTGVNLLKSQTFVFLCISSFMYTMGVFIPYIFIRSLADQIKVGEDKSVWLVSSLGIANTAGRIASGVLMSCVRVNAAMLVLGSTILSSMICFTALFTFAPESIFAFAVMFGFFTAPFVSLRPVMIVEFLGLEKLTNAFGLVLLSQGVACILGPPLAGFINDATGESSYTIVFAGALLMVAATTIMLSTLSVKKGNS